MSKDNVKKVQIRLTAALMAATSAIAGGGVEASAAAPDERGRAVALSEWEAKGRQRLMKQLEENNGQLSRISEQMDAKTQAIRQLAEQLDALSRQGMQQYAERAHRMIGMSGKALEREKQAASRQADQIEARMEKARAQCEADEQEIRQLQANAARLGEANGRMWTRIYHGIKGLTWEILQDVKQATDLHRQETQARAQCGAAEKMHEQAAATWCSLQGQKDQTLELCQELRATAAKGGRGYAAKLRLAEERLTRITREISQVEKLKEDNADEIRQSLESIKGMYMRISDLERSIEDMAAECREILIAANPNEETHDERELRHVACLATIHSTMWYQVMDNSPDINLRDRRWRVRAIYKELKRKQLIQNGRQYLDYLAWAAAQRELGDLAIRHARLIMDILGFGAGFKITIAEAKSREEAVSMRRSVNALVANLPGMPIEYCQVNTMCQLEPAKTEPQRLLLEQIRERVRRQGPQMREYIKREAEINKELYSAGVTEAREELEFLAGARDLRDHPDARGAPAGPIWEWASERRDALISYGAFIHPYDMPAQGSTFPNSKIKYARGMPMWTLLSSIDAGREENALRIMNRIRAVSVIHAAIFLEQYGIGVQNGLADIVNEDKFRELLSGDKRRRLQHLCYSLRMFRLKPLASVLHDLIDNSDPRLSDADRIPA